MKDTNVILICIDGGRVDRAKKSETFQNLNFDEDSPNYLPRKVGDRFVTIDSQGKLTNHGDYPNQSKFIRITGPNTSTTALEASSLKDLANVSKELLPMGFAALTTPTLSTLELAGPGPITEETATAPVATFVTNQSGSRGTFDSNVYLGFDFANETNKQYLRKPAVGAGTGNNTTAITGANNDL